MIIKIKRTDGGISIMYCLSNDPAAEVAKIFNNNEIVDWSEIQEIDLPKSRNYRDAWDHDLKIDLPKAKVIQKQLIVKKAYERIAADDFGRKDFTVVEDELKKLNIDQAKNIDELYNLWPLSIDNRTQTRKYEI